MLRACVNTHWPCVRTYKNLLRYIFFIWYRSKSLAEAFSAYDLPPPPSHRTRFFWRFRLDREAREDLRVDVQDALAAMVLEEVRSLYSTVGVPVQGTAIEAAHR